ncbi:transaldolase [Klebsormidium nitens]|uniref:Transaldolase n=2 Tax=Klebsormidium TaxID=3174 RepID=A0A1Y1HQG4_KLENI|nr:transaldolase [Klebsormidium nitens]|eukprot:GAQ78807.1 transaldolase [Klebsormidium nitens]
MVATEQKVATSTTLTELYEKEGQSPWLDNLKRDWLQNGELQKWIDNGVRGITSNPTIFQKAIEGSNAYDEQFRKLIEGGLSVEESYWELVEDDIKEALKLLRPLYDESDGGDGYVSIEVGPELARDSERTLAEARKLHAVVGQPNLLVKVPATQEGIEPIRVLTSEGISVNVTLIFSLERYEAVMEAYVSGLEQYEGDLSKVASVASFFISRVDVEIDNRLDAIGTPQALALKGKAGIAQAKLAYELFQRKFSGARWEALAARGARPQRPLWASTGTKNKAYSDVLYIEGLVGPDSVNTIPDGTLTAFLDHGKVKRAIDVDVIGAKRLIFGQLDVLGIQLDDVSKVLEDEGVASFQASGTHVFGALEAKAALLKAEK